MQSGASDMSDTDRSQGRDAARRARLAYLTVNDLSASDPAIVVIPDTETGEVNLGPRFIPADLVVQHLDLRLRLILMIDVEDPAMLDSPERLAAAELLLKHWPETAAVGFVANDAERTCLVLEPFDVEPSIGTPSGSPLPPTPRRHAAPLKEAIQSYIDVVAPNWEHVARSSELTAVGYEQLGYPISDEARLEIVGRRANIDEKRAALDSVDAADGKWAAELVQEAASGNLDSEGLARQIERRAAKRR
jgi:hypothetical protein